MFDNSVVKQGRVSELRNKVSRQSREARVFPGLRIHTSGEHVVVVFSGLSMVVRGEFKRQINLSIYEFVIVI